MEEGGSPLPKQAGYKGKIIKGSNFDVKTLGTFDKAKMMDLMAEVELSTQRLVQQEAALKNIRLKIRKHIMETGCQDAVLEEVINIYLF